MMNEQVITIGCIQCKFRKSFNTMKAPVRGVLSYFFAICVYIYIIKNRSIFYILTYILI